MPRHLLFTALASCLAAAPLAAAPAGDAVDLLQSADLLGPVALTLSAAEVRALRDDDPATSVTIPARGGAPVDLVFQLDADIAAPQHLNVVLATGQDQSVPAQIDLLVSTVSEVVGFSSVRNTSVDAFDPEIAFGFEPVAARWVMLRIFPAPEATHVTLADIALHGHFGPPESAYAFNHSPAEAIALIAELQTLDADAFELTPQEQALFADAAAGAVDVRAFETLALHASGVTRDSDRGSFIARIDALEAAARDRLDLTASRADVGGELLAWLHDEHLTGGYEEGQTDLHTLLDSGVYNCVSSAVIYVALGQRLGLDVRAIEVPDHAFAILYDGANHMDVETTTQQGFNPRRDRVAEFEELTGYTYIPQANKSKRREIDMSGLAALIYYNHGVTALQDGRYDDALVANFRALNLDPEFDSAVKNALAALGRWSSDLSDAQAWDRALAVAQVGVALAPADRALASRHIGIWQRQATSLASAGDLNGALAVLQEAAAAIPDEDFAPLEAHLFTQQAEELISAGQWQAALDATETGAPLLSEGAKAELENWRRGLFLRWSNALMDSGDFETAKTVMRAGLDTFPDDHRIAGNLRYLAQEGARGAGDYAQGLQFLQGMFTAFPEEDRLSRVARSYVSSVITDPAQTPDIATGLIRVDAARALFKDPGDITTLGAAIYERFGHPLIDAGDWAGAAEIYAAGRAAFPDARILTTNARYLAHEWQRQAFESGGPEALAAVNASLRGFFPDFAADSGFEEVQVKNQVITLANGGEFDAANEALDVAQLLLSAETYEELSTYVIDRSAAAAMDAGDWATAADIYAAGLSRFPEARQLSRNAVYVAQEWTRAAEQDASAVGVVAVMRQLNSLFPGHDKIAEMGVTTLRRAAFRDVDAGRIADARALVAAAVPELSEADAEELTVSLFSAIGQHWITARDWPAALQAYRAGQARYPNARDLNRNTDYIIQEWLADALRDGGAEGLIAAARSMRGQLRDIRDADKVMESLVGRRASALLDESPDAALNFVDAVSEVMPEDAVTDVKVYIYDTWARRLGEGGDWPAAIAVYDAGIAELGEVRHLTNNREWAAQQ